jgi:hypothetical protein
MGQEPTWSEMPSDRPDQIAKHEVGGADAPACVALVALAQPSRRAQIARLTARPDPTFVTHLIATAEQAPQTRNLRRAAPSDALSAYSAQPRPQAAKGSRTRQVI